MGEKGGAHGMGVGRRCMEREGLLEGKGWVRGTREMVSTYMSCEDREGERKAQPHCWSLIGLRLDTSKHTPAVF